MRIAAAQLRPIAGDIAANVRRHREFIAEAAERKAGLVLFPELSLTGYEPKLAQALAARVDDARWDLLQRASDAHAMTIGVGLPLAGERGVSIGMLFFQPGGPRCTYCKQMLHADELPYFVPGDEQLVLHIGRKKLVPAICYESLQPVHAEAAAAAGANIYLASVAKSAAGVARASAYYPAIARQHAFTVLMANCVGPCDDFSSAGQSALWNREGACVAQLDQEQEGLLFFDTQTQLAETVARG